MLSQSVSFRFNKNDEELEKEYLSIPKQYRTETIKRALNNELFNENKNDNTNLIELNKKLDSIDESLKTLVNILNNTSIKLVNENNKNIAKEPTTNAAVDDELKQDDSDKQAFLDGMKSFVQSVNG